MLQIKTLSLNKKLILTLTQFAALLSVATLAPLLKNQFITGPIVNAVLFISAALLGLSGAVLLALIPSIIALSAGLLPAVLAPAIPFIMLGNVLLVLSFNLLNKKNFWAAAAPAAVIKFLFLYSTSFIVSHLVAKQPIAAKAAQMLAWPQLITALSGAVIAYCFLKLISYNKGREQLTN